MVTLENATFTIQVDGFGQSEPTEDPAITRLKTKNPLWVKYAERWRFYMAAYEGGEEFANGDNLFKHPRENDHDFLERKDRLHNMNYCEPLVDFFTNFIFSESIDRSGGSNKTFYDEFVRDVNLKGESIDDFMRQVSDDMQIFGMSYVLVDTPLMPQSDSPNYVLTVQDEKDANLRPYWVLIKAEEVIDWTADPFDKIIYLKRLQIETVMDAEGKAGNLEIYTEFYPDKVIVTKVMRSDGGKTKLLSTDTHKNNYGKVPISVCRYKRSKFDAYMGVSFLRDFAYNQREIMNLTSLLQEFLYRQAFNILAKQTDSAIPLKEQEDPTLGTGNVLEYPLGVHAPQYITPPSDPAKFIQDERGRIKNEMYARAAQDALNELFNGEKSSGFSQAQSFYKTVPFISSRADSLERMENGLMELTLDIMGKKWNGKCKYKDRYELTNLTDALAQLTIILKDFAVPSETFVKEEIKRVIRQYDSKLPVEVINKIESEVDKMDFQKWVAQVQPPVPPPPPEPGSGPAPTGSGPQGNGPAGKKPDTIGTTDITRNGNQDANRSSLRLST
jgi:hypothetical protein